MSNIYLKVTIEKKSSELKTSIFQGGSKFMFKLGGPTHAMAYYITRPGMLH